MLFISIDYASGAGHGARERASESQNHKQIIYLNLIIRPAKRDYRWSMP